jgi:hypothetical protein
MTVGSGRLGPNSERRAPFMKIVRARRANNAADRRPVSKLIPRTEPATEGYTNRFVMDISGVRYELTCSVGLRPVRNAPGKVVEMPRRD